MESVTYKFRNRGVLLSLPNGGRRLDVIRTKAFEDYIRDHLDKWFSWARNIGLGIECMEDLILVSGCTMVTSWAAAAWAEISLTSRLVSNVGPVSFGAMFGDVCRITTVVSTQLVSQPNALLDMR